MSNSVSNSFSARIARLVACLASIGVTSWVAPAVSADLTWSGNYRVEAIHIKNPELGGPQSTKEYMLHHLTLTPKIQAADGLTIYSRFDILNDQNFGIDPAGRVYSVAGDVFGNGPGGRTSPNGATDTVGSAESNSFGRTQRASYLAVTSLYASWAQEFGQLVVGRTPFQFGLGSTFNAGNGLFDHFIDTKDMIGYKIILGNLFIFPILSKTQEGFIGQSDDTDEYIVQAQYDNPETELSLGAIYQMRHWTSISDLPTEVSDPDGVANGTAGATRGGNGKTSLMGFYTTQKLKNFTIGVEADFMTGSTGLRTAGGNDVKINAYGVVGEVRWRKEESKLSALLKLGLASGDDPNSTDSYEGFMFSRNYDVAMLLFNHPLGQRDFLRTGRLRGTKTTPAANDPDRFVNNQIDSETLSNTMFVSPSVQYQWKDNMAFGGAMTYAMLNKEPIPGGDTGKSLGFEIDLNFTFKPYERLTWITEAGFLLPGDAWKGGSQNLDNKFAYGVSTKAAISF